MAADDAAKGTPDPWDDIVAGLGETASELSFNFDEADQEPVAAPDDADAAPADVAEAADASLPDAMPPDDTGTVEPDDALVDEWLAGMEDVGEVGTDLGVEPAADAAEEPPALAVFAPDDTGAVAAGSGEPSFGAFDVDAADDSAGTPGDAGDAAADAATDADLVDFLSAADAGQPAAEVDPWDALGGADDAPEDALAPSAEAEQTAADPIFAGDDLDAGDDGGFPDVAVAAAGAATAAAMAPASRPAKAAPPRPRKKPSAIGQIVGIVLGGLMAIPITLAILIWGLGKDPFKVTKMVPEQVAFLLPEKFRPGYQKPAADGGTTAGPTLDSLPTPDLATAEPDGQPAPTDVATVDPADTAGAGEVMPEPDLPDLTEPDPGSTTEPAAPVDEVAAAAPATLEPAAPAPPPLDTSGLDAAVTEAAGLVEALGAVDDSTDRTRKKLLVEWYKSLARVGEQLVMVEKAAADSGRPLEETPAGVVELHAGIAAQPALAGELERLGRNWLSYQKRDSHGVVLPMTFESARRVGPYWVTKAALAQSDGTNRAVAVISRAEPSAVAGDRLVFTGIVLDGDVVWAADCRAPGAARADQADPLF